MPYLLATYERMNFTTKPAMRQTCDVLFHTEYEGEYLMSGDRINPYYLPEQVEADLDAAAEKQVGDAFSLEFPDSSWGGWSSIMLDKVVILDDPLDTMEISEPVEGSPQLGELFDYRGSKYHISGFYKEFVSSHKPDPMTEELLAKLRAEEPVNPYHVGKRRIKLAPCLPHEATYVCGSGIGGCLVAISDITITGLVGWSKRHIARNRIDYNAGIQREYDSGGFPHLTEKWVKDV